MNPKKKSLTIISIVLVVTIVLTGGLSAIFSYVYHYKGHEVINEWHSTDVFDISTIPVVEKESGKDFVILNLADIQICDLEDISNRNIIHDEITYLVNTTHPNLITLTGDQTWSNENLISLKCIIGWMDNYKIPWAPVFGNHDYGNDYDSSVASLNYCCDLYEKSKYCLFNRGPSNLGTLGNYVINIVEDGTIIKTLYMMDAGYNDELTNQQKEWFKWNIEGIKVSNSDIYTEGMCFMHKPIPEYIHAYWDYINGGSTTSINGFYDYCSLSGLNQTGFFDIAKNSGVTDFICGHQHTNNFTLNYEGVRLTFALKTGELSFYYDDGEINLNGATTITLSNGETNISNVYVDSNQFHIRGSENIFCA